MTPPINYNKNSTLTKSTNSIKEESYGQLVAYAEKIIKSNVEVLTLSEICTKLQEQYIIKSAEEIQYGSVRKFFHKLDQLFKGHGFRFESSWIETIKIQLGVKNVINLSQQLNKFLASNNPKCDDKLIKSLNCLTKPHFEILMKNLFNNGLQLAKNESLIQNLTVDKKRDLAAIRCSEKIKGDKNPINRCELLPTHISLTNITEFFTANLNELKQMPHLAIEPYIEKFEKIIDQNIKNYDLQSRKKKFFHKLTQFIQGHGFQCEAKWAISIKSQFLGLSNRPAIEAEKLFSSNFRTTVN